MPRKIKGMPLNKARCHTCPFNEHGCPETRVMVEQRCLTEASQICHGTGDKTLCRGARDFQLQAFHRIGLLSEPTDECWEATWRKMNGERP